MTLVVDTLREAAPLLRRPFSVKALKWKVQATWPKDEPTGALIVCYIDRGLVVDRLNLVVPHLWWAHYEDMDRGFMRCALTVDGIQRIDIGHGADPKARTSDSLKRAAVQFGIGVSLTRIPQSMLDVNTGRVKRKQTREGMSLVIEQGGLDYLRTRYEMWLQQVGVEVFGEPLEHGDTGDAQGDDTDASPDLLDEHAIADLYLALSENRTLRQQRGILEAAGVKNLPVAVTTEIVSQAIEGLTGEQAHRVGELLNGRAES